MPARANLTIPASGYSAALWYFFVTCQATVYFPSRRDFNRAFGAVEEPLHIEQIDPATVTLDGETLPLVKVCVYQDWVLVLIQGSTTNQQLFRQFAPERQAIYSPSGGRVSEYYLSRGTAMYDAIKLYVGDFVNLGRKLVIVGHSYGAALATILGPWFARDYPGKLEAVVCFGSPRVGDHLFSDNYPVRLLNISAEGDKIPGFPPDCTGPLPLFIRSAGLGAPFNQWRHAGTEFLLIDDGSVYNFSADLLYNDANLSYAQAFEESLAFEFEKHYPGHYAANIRKNLPYDNEPTKRETGVSTQVLDEMNIAMAQAWGSLFIIARRT